MTTTQILEKIPEKISHDEVLQVMVKERIYSRYLKLFKVLTVLSDEAISDNLNMNVKTFRKYRDTKAHPTNPLLQEQIILLTSLFKHALDIFGSKEELTEWFSKPNFFFGKKTPLSYLKTISGIKFVDDRLTSMEYGDNA